MKLALLMIGLPAVLVLTGSGQTTDVSKLRFKGIGLDSTYGQVIRALGRPVKDLKATPEECAGGREKVVEYRGATLLFMDAASRNSKTFEMMGFEVTSARFIVSGIKVGDPQSVVRRQFGTRFSKQKDDQGREVWFYEFSDTNSPGATSIYFARGRVIRISSGYTVC